jgi:hypothetical protein
MNRCGGAGRSSGGLDWDADRKKRHGLNRAAAWQGCWRRKERRDLIGRLLLVFALFSFSVFLSIFLLFLCDFFTLALLFQLINSSFFDSFLSGRGRQEGSAAT